MIRQKVLCCQSGVSSPILEPKELLWSYTTKLAGDEGFEPYVTWHITYKTYTMNVLD